MTHHHPPNVLAVLPIHIERWPRLPVLVIYITMILVWLLVHDAIIPVELAQVLQQLHALTVLLLPIDMPQVAPVSVKLYIMIVRVCRYANPVAICVLLALTPITVHLAMLLCIEL